MAVKKKVGVFEKLFDLIAEANADLSSQYPDVPVPELKVDKKTGKEYLGKGSDELNKQFLKARQAAQKDIDAGNYDPMFPVDQREFVDPSNYDLQGNTLTDTLPKTQKTIDAKRAQFDTPEARAALNAAFDKKADDPLAINWYAMKQLEDEFIKMYGEELGRKMYKERFADAMAATTGGADPGANLVSSAYGNFMRQQGLRAPERAYEMPSPVGGRFISGNMQMYNKVLNDGRALTTADQPKRFNFSANFLGDMGRATIDEQMTAGMTGGKFNAPPQGSYGIIENIVGEEAAKRGIQPGNMQDVAWAGLKDIEGKPMITFVNEAIERTSQLTGLAPEVIKDLYLKGMPLYGATGLGVMNQESIMGALDAIGQEQGTN